MVDHGQGNPNNGLPFWGLHFPSLRTLTIDVWQATLFGDLGSVKGFFLAHAATLEKLIFTRCNANISRIPTELKFTERNGQLMLQAINTNLRTFTGMVEQDFLTHIAPWIPPIPRHSPVRSVRPN
jgi:hypothetical protein